MSLILKMCKVALDLRTFQNALYNHLHTSQQLVTSRLEPSLELFQVSSQRDFQRCLKTVAQYTELFAAFVALVQQRKLSGLQFIVSSAPKTR